MTLILLNNKVSRVSPDIVLPKVYKKYSLKEYLYVL